MFEVYRLLAVGISLWNQFAVPVLFSVFWFVLFTVQLYSDATNGNGSLGHQGILFFLLSRWDLNRGSFWPWWASPPALTSS